MQSGNYQIHILLQHVSFGTSSFDRIAALDICFTLFSIVSIHDCHFVKKNYILNYISYLIFVNFFTLTHFEPWIFYTKKLHKSTTK